MMISFLGKTMFDTAGASYKRTKYRFSDGTEVGGSFFGKVLLDYLGKKNTKAEKLVLVGGYDASWWVASELVPPELRTNLLGYKALLTGECSHDTLEQFCNTIQRLVDFRISFEPIEMTKDVWNTQRQIVKNLIKHLEPSVDAIVLDVTHATRFLPLVALGILLPARYVSVKSIRVFYGHFETEEEPKPALELTALEELIQFDEKMAAFHLTGDFSQVATTLVPTKREFVRKVYFSFELNQPDTGELVALANATKNYFFQPVAEAITRFGRAGNLHDLFYEKALFHFEKNQYFKAIPLLFEAILSVIGHKAMGQPINNYKVKERVKQLIPKILGKEEAKLFEKLQQLRNRIVHGIKAPKESGISEYLSKEAHLRELFKKCCELYERVKREPLDIADNRVREKLQTMKRSLQIIEGDEVNFDEIF